MFIQTESTPNPATLKFLPGQTVLDTGTADFPTAEAAAPSPLAQRIFAVSGVTGIFFGHDFVTVTKADEVAWDHIKPAILGAVMEHFQSGDPVWRVMKKPLATTCTPAKTGTSWARSRNCSTRVCALPWRRTAATSRSTALIAALCTCTCKAHARAAPLPR